MAVSPRLQLWLIPSLLLSPLLAMPLLGAKSTASEVVCELRSSLPSYAQRGAAAVVTGGNSGIGKESVRALLEAGCRVVLCSRDAEAGARSLAGLGVPAGRCRVQQLDLADLSSVAAAADQIRRTEGRVGLLLNNAGVMATPRGQTKQGFELQLGTNHLGHHALTRLLLPIMDDDGRVVTVASSAHTMARVDTSDLFFARRKYTPWGAYGQSKAANILFAKGLSDRLREANSQILSVSLHPGVIGTPLWRHGNPALTWLIHRFILNKDVQQGAATSLYASLASGLPDGAYLSDCAVATPSAACQDEDKQARTALWEISERLLMEAGLSLPEQLVSSERGIHQ
ncbi:hypothetical protein AB1Y20_013507 [Prymnesium parvum]|uniref:Protochlorophyllide reductase n=1 Tax=Prymnesium parvum TaxID=97485 RepID=A0AB34IIT8_PRYPA